MIVCVLLPRFALTVAADDRAELLRVPCALAPEPGREALIGEVSPAAEAAGVRPGLRMGEALARCPTLQLVPPDPVGVADAWERVLVRLESIGAGVESGQPGEACFDARGLRRLHGGHVDGVLAATRAALRRPARLGAAPTRFGALAAATRARPRVPVVVTDAPAGPGTVPARPGGAGAGSAAARAFLAPQPVELLRHRPELAALPPLLERLGIATLGELAALPRAAVADRFGPAGVTAHRLARGEDDPVRPRTAGERLEESLDLPEAANGPQLERALALLVDRLLARRERDGRTIRAAVVSATLVEGGTWRERVVFREATADAGRMRLALAGKLMLLPAPAETLRLAADRLGPPHGTGGALFEDGTVQRRARLREAVRQARAAAGPDAALRVLAVDPGSRVPERRTVLTPFES
jgi:protein ImuB